MEKKTATAPPPDLSGKRVLIVEDDKDTREFLLAVIERTKAGICVVEDGIKAWEELDKAAEDGLDLVLLDFMIPGISGGDILKKREFDVRLKKIPVILITAYPDKFVDSETADFDSISFLIKPPKVSDIYTAIRESLELPND